MRRESGKTWKNNDDPSDRNGPIGIPFRPNGNGRDRVDYSQKSVDAHDNQGVDADIGRDNNQVLHSLAPNHSKGPVGHDIIGGCKWHTEYDKEEVGHC